MRRWSRWLALATVVFVCATATAAMGGAPADRNEAATVAFAGRDTDSDGLSDDAEVRRYRTDPRKRDTDRDGLRDGDEVRRYKTNPRKSDTDGDDLTDAAEVRRYRTDPRKRDTDRDGLRDGDEVRRYKTNPRKSDTDGDDLTDAAEVSRYRTDPRKRDTDRDGLRDGDEVRRYKTNPRERDSDGDGWGDRVEVNKGTNPSNPRSRPGFPREDNTGVPRGTVLTPYTGPSNISTPNTVIDGKTMGCIEVSAPGVVIRNSKVSCPGGGVNIEDRGHAVTSLLIEDTEIDCGNVGGSGIGAANITARRVNIHGCENGLAINQNVTLEDSYIHDLYNGGEAHMDGMQLSSGHWDGSAYVCCALNVTIRHNTIYAIDPSGAFGSSAIQSNPNLDANILIENNLMAGGSYTLYCDYGGTGVNYRVLNNRFSTKFGSKVGAFGPATGCSDETQSGNVYHETGRPLRLD